MVVGIVARGAVALSYRSRRYWRRLDEQVIAYKRRQRLWRRGMEIHLMGVTPLPAVPRFNEVFIIEPWYDPGTSANPEAGANAPSGPAWNVFYATTPWWGGGSWSGRNIQ